MTEPAVDGRRATLPRTQSGPNPQHLLLTILGDYWSGHAEPVPSSGLVALLAEFDTSEAGARSALSRLTTRGVLQMTRSGRRTSYRLTPSVDELGAQTAQRIFAFAKHADVANWHGQWTVVTFSVPESERHLRSSLGTKLRWHGFAAIQDGVWVAPRDFTPELESVLTEAAGINVAAFSGKLEYPTSIATRGLLGGVQLTRLEERYRAFVEQFAPVLEAARGGRLDPAEAFVSRSLATDVWRGLYRADPQLPSQLLGPQWPQPEAGQLFLALYDLLGPAAEERCAQILQASGSGDAVPRHFTSAGLPGVS
ncbi:MAG TPA: PaaX family transcriptional regulator C-terminal domain-containing protein [Microbacterium sp.]|nr:PaaX family transcriptional regulator C-terminal domain-containing protein [Microbacterium sp.]